MDRHLNVFLPYGRSPQHEDQLTRAAMIVMRAVPLARDALLARIGSPPSARLPEPELDMQARDVLTAPVLSDAGGFSLHQLISVFLSPDVGRDLSAAAIEERAGGQRLDGVLRFGYELVVVIESKIVGAAPSDQARLLRLRGVEAEDSEVVGLGWHVLLEDWWALLVRGLLAPAERVLMEDLIAAAEEHFSHLLPFTTLGRAGERALRRQRRLMALLREATGINDVEPERRPQVGAAVMLAAAIGTRSTQRISLQIQAETLALCTWPAELKPQAAALYQTGRTLRLAEFVAEHAERPGRPGSTCISPTGTPPPGSGSTCTVTLSCRLHPPLIRRGFRPDPRAPPRPHPRRPLALAPSAPVRSSAHSSSGSAGATSICVPVSQCGDSGPGHTRSTSTSAARSPAKYAKRSPCC